MPNKVFVYNNSYSRVRQLQVDGQMFPYVLEAEPVIRLMQGYYVMDLSIYANEVHHSVSPLCVVGDGKLWVPTPDSDEFLKNGD